MIDLSEDVDDGHLLESIITLLSSSKEENKSYMDYSIEISDKKNKLRDLIQSCEIDRIETLIQSLKDMIDNKDGRDDGDSNNNIKKQLQPLQDIDITGIWFIILKQCYPEFIYHIYEMNQFAQSFNLQIPQPKRWIDKTLNNMYDKLVCQLDKTIFYTKDFIKSNFTTSQYKIWENEGLYLNLNASVYFNGFIIDDHEEEQSTLFKRFIDPKKDSTLITNIYNRSLTNYYITDHDLCSGKEIIGNHQRYACIDFIESSNYTILHVKIREMLFLVIKEVFEFLRDYYASHPNLKEKEQEEEEEEEDEANHSNEIERINEIFDAYITRFAGINKGDEIKNWMVDIPSIFGFINDKIINYEIKDKRYQLILEKRLITTFQTIALNVNKKYIKYNDTDSYKLLFNDTLYDANLKINREKYDWILPFNEREFIQRISSKTTISWNDSLEYISDILIDESIMWYNLLIYQIEILKRKDNEKDNIKYIESDEERKEKIVREYREKKQKKNKKKKNKKSKKELEKERIDEEEEVEKKRIAKEVKKRLKEWKKNNPKEANKESKVNKKKRELEKEINEQEEEEKERPSKKKRLKATTFNTNNKCILSIIEGYGTLFITEENGLKSQLIVHQGMEINIPINCTFEIIDDNNDID